jgi:8-oxo-dGTP diphosphatase
MKMKPGQDYIGVGVGAMIFNAEGNVFLAQRGPKAGNERGCWEFPGGAVDYCETLEDAIRREIDEEFGMKIEIESLLTVHNHILEDEGQHWVSPTYIARHISTEPQIREPDKCSDMGWFALDSLPLPLSKVSQEDIKAYHPDTESIVVREASAIELPKVLNIIHTAYEPYRGKFLPAPGALSETLEAIEGKIAKGKGFIASLNHQVVGCVLCELREGYLYFGRLAVLPNFQRRGIASKLIQQAEKYAQENSLHRVQMGSRIALEGNRRLYERLGYHVIGAEPHPGYTEPTHWLFEKEV